MRMQSHLGFSQHVKHRLWCSGFVFWCMLMEANSPHDEHLPYVHLRFGMVDSAQDDL